MCQICLYIPLEDYLAQWFIHEHGGEVPVRLIRGSVESKILEVFLTHWPEDRLPDIAGDGKLAIVIPSFRNRPPSAGVPTVLPSALLRATPSASFTPRLV